MQRNLFFANMYSPLQLATKFLKYWFTASNGKGHGIHSPFVFEFITQVLNDRKAYYSYEKIESLRSALLANESVLTIEDFGAGSRISATKKRSVQSIAGTALKPKKFGQLLFRIANFYQPKNIMELGTSLGITSAYLASANQHATVVTMEGASEVAAVARDNFNTLDLQNIQLKEGNFDETLPAVLSKMQTVDLAFIDGNHRLEPTVNYFKNLLPYCHENSILVFDDVHWSKEMERAWESIKSHESVLLTIDLFFIGLVFFRKDFKIKQHFTIRF
ncbi:MAG: class I SAM-dependent methyltransferase [Bacteroidota bacterium]